LHAYRRRPFQKRRSAVACHEAGRATERGLPLVLATAQAVQPINCAPLLQMWRWQLSSLSPVHRISIIFRVVRCRFGTGVASWSRIHPRSAVSSTAQDRRGAEGRRICHTNSQHRPVGLCTSSMALVLRFGDNPSRRPL
jgi:hypothetical protein